MAVILGHWPGVASAHVRLRKSSQRRQSVRLIWSVTARFQLREIHDYIAKDKPDAASRVVNHLLAAVESLELYPNLGSPLGTSELRQLVIGGTPYVVVYRKERNSLRILNVFHGAQQRPSG